MAQIDYSVLANPADVAKSYFSGLEQARSRKLSDLLAQRQEEEYAYTQSQRAQAAQQQAKQQEFYKGAGQYFEPTADVRPMDESAAPGFSRTPNYLMNAESRAASPSTLNMGRMGRDAMAIPGLEGAGFGMIQKDQEREDKQGEARQLYQHKAQDDLKKVIWKEIVDNGTDYTDQSRMAAVNAIDPSLLVLTDSAKARRASGGGSGVPSFRPKTVVQNGRTFQGKFNDRTGDYSYGPQFKPNEPFNELNFDPGAVGARAVATASGKETGEGTFKLYESARQSKDVISKSDVLIKHLNESKTITGLGSDVFLGMEKMKALLGSRAAAGKVTDTEIAEVMMSSEVFPLIQSLGIGARGMDTPAEREFMRQVLTGAVSLNKQTLIKMAELRKSAANKRISEWDAGVDEGRYDTFFTASQMPPTRFGTPKVQKETAQPTGSPKIGTIENGFVFLGGNPSSPSSWKKQ